MNSILNLIPLFIFILIIVFCQTLVNRKAKRNITKFLLDVHGEIISRKWTWMGEVRRKTYNKEWRAEYYFTFKIRSRIYNGYLVSRLGNYGDEWKIDGQWVDDPVEYIQRKIPNRRPLSRRRSLQRSIWM